MMQGVRFLDRVHTIDARGWRPLPKLPFEACDRFGFAFSRDLDVARRKIAHPAVDAFANGCVVHEKPEAYALHSTGDEIAPRGGHYRTGIRG